MRPRHLLQNREKIRLFVVSFIFLTFLLSSSVSAYDAAAELERLMQEQAELEVQWQNAQDALTYFESEQSLEQSNLAFLLERSAEQQALYEEQAKQVAAITKIMQSLERSLEISIRQYEEQKVLYADRIENMYNLHKKSQLELLLESDSLEAYFTTLRLMKLISDADEQDLQSMREARDELIRKTEETKKQLGDYNTLLSIIEMDMLAIEANVQLSQSNVAAMDAELQALYGAVEQYYDDHFQLQLDIDEAQRQKEQQEYLAQLAAAQAGGYSAITYSGGGFIWPCPANDGVTSEFGPRSIPEAGIYDFHTGIDFAADYGTTCIAAASGTVVFAGWMTYGGNTVKIDIGSGIVIMYCHLNDIYVAQGQYVNAGDIVGAVGSTGLSTGPHLHFEVQVGGSPVDPRLYLY